MDDEFPRTKIELKTTQGNIKKRMIYVSKFRRIYAEDPTYKMLNEQFKVESKRFEEFLNKESNSGKPSSYRRHLIRFLVHLNEILDESVKDLKSMKTVEQIEQLVKMPDFPKFNKETDHFYSATFSAFKRYVKVVVKSEVEEQIDDDLNNFLQQGIINIEGKKLVNKPTKRKSKQNIKGTFTYPRSELEMMRAKVNSNWECEVSASHKTFINEKLNKPFVEGHHLIPMSAQEQFENTIDFADNIVTLCPNCHRKIHYGLQEDKYRIIQLFYNKRKNLFPEYGIEITLNDLLSFYKIEE